MYDCGGDDAGEAGDEIRRGRDGLGLLMIREWEVEGEGRARQLVNGH